MEHHDALLIFFCDAGGDGWQRRSWRRRWRIMRRHPRWAYYWFLTWLVQIVGKSPLAHVSVGHHGAVLDPHIQGNRFFALDGYILAWPTVVGFYRVPALQAVDLDAWQSPSRKPVWRTLLRWWTGGRVQTGDCVCVAVQVLRAAGVDVPARIYQPVQLYRWLEQQGYEYVSLRVSAG